ncbi:MAG: glycosyltransferase [Anaerolineales bacterium]
MTISNYNVNFLQGVAPSAAITPVHVVHCGIDSAKFKVDTDKQRSELFKIICVGRLETIKGHQYLIEACSQLKAEHINFRCYLVGDGELSSRIQQEINRLGLASYVEMLGFQTHDKVAALLNEVDLLVLPSLSEGIPVAVMEGMAAGLPIVATAVTGVPELVENGVTGILVPSKDSAALAEAIRTLSLSPELRIQMGRAGRKKVLNEFSLQKSASELYNVLANS